MTSYEDLYSRLHYLDKAKQHIEDVIAEKRSPKGTVSYVSSFLRQRSTGGAKGTGDEPLEHVMSLSDLNSHLNTINLQVEVTIFMHRCAVEAGGVSGVRAIQDDRLPTLFGKGHVRAETVVQVNNVAFISKRLLLRLLVFLSVEGKIPVSIFVFHYFILVIDCEEWN